MARAIDLEVTRSELVPLRQKVPATLLGSGKAKEFGHALEAEPAELVVVDAALTPGAAAQSRAARGRPRSSTGPA